MPSLLLDPLALSVCGLAAVLVGVVELVAALARMGRPWARSLSLAGVLALAVGGAFAVELPSYFWLPLLALAVVELGLAGARARGAQLTRGFWPSAQALVLIAAGGLLSGWQLYAFDNQFEQDLAATESLMAELADPIAPDAEPACIASTDKGNTVPLYTAAPGTGNMPHEAEERYVRDQHLSLKVIQTAPADAKYNCHGWVFTGGRYWLRGKQVEQVLTDNAYQEVAQPAAGDVAIFRDPAGQVSHTGLVRTGESGSGVLIESKWGRLGRYIHTAEEHVYRGHSVTYYRSPRSGHVLHGVES